MVYPLNRAIVRAMLDETSLNGVEANRVFNSAPKLELASFKFYTHDLDKKVVNDKTLALDLDKTEELAKTNEIVFDSLVAAALATNDVEIVRQYWSTDRGLVTICSAIAAGVSILVTSVLVYKINRLIL